MGHPLLDERIHKLKAKKQNLLTMKKSERGNQLKETDNVLGRLKRWNDDLSQKQTKDETN